MPRLGGPAGQESALGCQVALCMGRRGVKRNAVEDSPAANLPAILEGHEAKRARATEVGRSFGEALEGLCEGFNDIEKQIALNASTYAFWHERVYPSGYQNHVE